MFKIINTFKANSHGINPLRCVFFILIPNAKKRIGFALKLLR